ncbi:hypothetical protein ABWK90_004476 [Vibrio vulnificus]
MKQAFNIILGGLIAYLFLAAAQDFSEKPLVGGVWFEVPVIVFSAWAFYIKGIPFKLSKQSKL